MAQCTSPAGMGRKDRARCRWCTATATFFCWQCVCVLCAREKEWRLKGLCIGLYVGFLEAMHYS